MIAYDVWHFLPILSTRTEKNSSEIGYWHARLSLIATLNVVGERAEPKI